MTRMDLRLLWAITLGKPGYRSWLKTTPLVQAKARGEAADLADWRYTRWLNETVKRELREREAQRLQRLFEFYIAFQVVGAAASAWASEQ